MRAYIYAIEYLFISSSISFYIRHTHTHACVCTCVVACMFSNAYTMLVCNVYNCV